MKKQSYIIIFILCYVGMNIMANNLTDLSKQLPAEINGWEKDSEHTVYDSKTLFKYIDGGAELYISYNFKHVLAQKYKKGEGIIT